MDPFDETVSVTAITTNTFGNLPIIDFTHDSAQFIIDSGGRKIDLFEMADEIERIKEDNKQLRKELNELRTEMQLWKDI
jgi:hypothetical protein